MGIEDIPTHFGPKFEVTLKLDPGQLVELMELAMSLRPVMVNPPEDPEAEAADLLAIQQERQKERCAGARQERERIVAHLRRMDNDGPPAVSLAWLAEAIEDGEFGQ